MTSSSHVRICSHLGGFPGLSCNLQFSSCCSKLLPLWLWQLQPTAQQFCQRSEIAAALGIKNPLRSAWRIMAIEACPSVGTRSRSWPSRRLSSGRLWSSVGLCHPANQSPIQPRRPTTIMLLSLGSSRTPGITISHIVVIVSTASRQRNLLVMVMILSSLWLEIWERWVLMASRQQSERVLPTP